MGKGRGKREGRGWGVSGDRRESEIRRERESKRRDVGEKEGKRERT